MNESNMLQLFAINKVGDICHVEDVGRGLACDCSCPKCNEPVVAKQGGIRGWHFAHSSGADCAGGAETAIHIAAKQIIMKEMGMMLPKVNVTVEHTLADGRIGHGTSCRPEIWADFLRVEQEQNFGQIRPDIVAFLNDTMMFVEIAVTHFVDLEKSKEIKKFAVPTLEIDLSELRDIRIDWSSLKDIVIEGVDNKVWIYPLANTILYAEAMLLAAENALGKDSVPEQPFSKREPQKFKYIINSRTVYLTEHPYCVKVWIQPDMAVVNVVKPILKKLGGNYRKQTNDWWFPAEATADLHAELSVMSSSKALATN